MGGGRWTRTMGFGEEEKEGGGGVEGGIDPTIWTEEIEDDGDDHHDNDNLGVKFNDAEEEVEQE